MVLDRYFKKIGVFALMFYYKLGHLFLGWPFVNQLNLNILVIFFFCKFLEKIDPSSVRMNSPLYKKKKKKTRGSSSKTLCGKIAQLNATERHRWLKWPYLHVVIFQSKILSKKIIHSSLKCFLFFLYVALYVKWERILIKKHYLFG